MGQDENNLLSEKQLLQKLLILSENVTMKNQSLLLLYDSKIKEGEVNLIAKTLRDVYQINIKEIRAHDTANFAYDKTRNQYDGQKLLNNLIDESKLRFFFWIILDDLFVPVMNFVFGLASKYYGAIVSFHRLDNTEMRIKESIHECGHILGLGHCDNFCVMQYSNSLTEALEKPSLLCDSCKISLSKNKEFLYETKVK